MGFAELIPLVDRTVVDLLGDEPVIYQPSASGGGSFSGAFSHAFSSVAFPAAVEVTGIFDASYLLVRADADGGALETVVPAVFLELADLPTDPMTDDPTLIIRGTTYRVFERRPADFGSIVLALRKVV